MKWRYTRPQVALATCILTVCYVSAAFGGDSPMVLLTYERGGCGAAETRDVDLEQVAQLVNKGLNGQGTAKVLKDGRIQVEVRGEHDKASLDSIKDRIVPTGCMEFRVLADSNYPNDKAIIELAKLLPPAKTEVLQGDKKVAEWVVLNPKEFDANNVAHSGMVTRSKGNSSEALVLIDDENVSGAFITSAIADCAFIEPPTRGISGVRPSLTRRVTIIGCAALSSKADDGSGHSAIHFSL